MNMKDLIKRLYGRFRNLILYGIIGGFCAALDYAVSTGLVYSNILPDITVFGYLFHAEQVALAIGIHVGIFTSFILNRSYNFKVKNKTAVRFLSFYAIGLFGWFISAVMLHYMVVLGDMKFWAFKLIATVVVALIQFVLNKFITFYTHKK